MARNFTILIPEYYFSEDEELTLSTVNMGITFPENSPGGGIGQGMRLGKCLGVAVIDISKVDKGLLRQLYQE